MRGLCLACSTTNIACNGPTSGFLRHLILETTSIKLDSKAQTAASFSISKGLSDNDQYCSVTVPSLLVLFTQFAVLPLVDNPCKASHSYEIHVYTGFAKGAETDSAVSIVLIGTAADSGQRALDDGERKVIMPC